MSKHKKTWKTSEKLEVINYYRQHGMAKTTREFKVSTTSVYNWSEAYDKSGESGLERKQSIVSKGELAELRKLRRENTELKKLVAEKELRLRIKDELLKKSR